MAKRRPSPSRLAWTLIISGSALVFGIAWIYLNRGSRASNLEITWTAIAVIGLGFTIWHTVDNWLNLRAVRKAIKLGLARKWGPRWWLAVASLGSTCGLMVVWLGFFASGVLAMTVPPPLTADREAVGEAIGWTLIAMEAVLAGVQVWQVFCRMKMRALRDASSKTLDDMGRAADVALGAAQDTVMAAQVSSDTIHDANNRQSSQDEDMPG